MSEVSYSNVPPMMAAIRGGDMRHSVPCFMRGILPMSRSAIR